MNARGISLSIVAVLVLLCVALVGWRPESQDCRVSVRLEDYWPTPGTSWRMHTVSMVGEGDLVVTVHEPVLFGDVWVTPWTFVKDSDAAYWYPGMPENLSFYVVEPTVSALAYPAWDAYVWALGHQRTHRHTGMLVDQVWYRTTIDRPYAILWVKEAVLPLELHSDNAFYQSPAVAETMPPALQTDAAPMVGGGVSWWIRMQLRPRPGHTVLQIDYYEGSTGAIRTAANLIRETWYFQPGVGLVEIRQFVVMDTPEAFRTSPQFQTEEITQPQTRVLREGYPAQ